VIQIVPTPGLPASNANSRSINGEGSGQQQHQSKKRKGKLKRWGQKWGFHSVPFTKLHRAFIPTVCFDCTANYKQLQFTWKPLSRRNMFLLPSYTSQFPCDTSHPNAPHSSARCSHQPRVRELLGVSIYSRKYSENRKISLFWLISLLDKLPAHHCSFDQSRDTCCDSIRATFKSSERHE
jgi:hypothetical protein